jgi:hypothetical protein
MEWPATLLEQGPMVSTIRMIGPESLPRIDIWGAAGRKRGGNTARSFGAIEIDLPGGE